MSNEKTSVTLSAAELSTIATALKLAELRYGMLLQLADQRRVSVLDVDAVAELQRRLLNLPRS